MVWVYISSNFAIEKIDLNSMAAQAPIEPYDHNLLGVSRPYEE